MVTILSDNPNSVAPGGLDSMSMLTPHPNGCPGLYEEYKTQRGTNLALDPDLNEMVEIAVGSDSDPQPCTSFGVHHSISVLKESYDAGYVCLRRLLILTFTERDSPRTPFLHSK